MISNETEGTRVEVHQNLYFYAAEYYKATHRPMSAIYTYERLYDALLQHQIRNNQRVHKGYPLVRLSEVYESIGYPWHSERFLMLTLVEDAITDNGVCKRTGGVYWRMWPARIHDGNYLDRLYREAWSFVKTYTSWKWSPEAVLLNLNTEWRVSQPSLAENVHYRPNQRFLGVVFDAITTSTSSDGKCLELLAHYLLCCMPGTITERRRITNETDYDVYCTIDGQLVDFRADLGRHWICECKDVSGPVGYSDVAKFSRTVDSSHCKVGILFARNGISGQRDRLYAERATAKLFQQHGIVVIVLTLDDLRPLLTGGSIITVLRQHYEKIRHDFMK
jgi:hypothetical protein